MRTREGLSGPVEYARPMLSPDRRPRLFAALVAAAALCSAVPALAAQIKDVRVGSHPKFTRIVFELDGKAGYKVERAGTDAAPELRITIEASSSTRSLRASGDVRSVKVDAGTQARAHIALRASGLRVREMLLSDPARIVIDVVRPETAVAAATASKPAPKPAAETKPAPKPVAEAKPSPAPSPKPIAEAKPAPSPSPKPIAEAKPSPSPKVEPPPPTPKPIAEAKPSPAPSPKPIAEASPSPSPSPAPPAVIPAPRAGESKPSENFSPPPLESPKPATTESASAPEVSPAPDAAPTPPDAAKLPPALPSPAPMQPAPPVAVTPPSPSAPTTVAPKPAPSSSWTDRLGDPLALGLIGAAVLGLLAIAVVWRRRRALPNDLDVTAIAEEVEHSSSESGASSRIPSGGFAMGDDRPSAPESSFGGLFDQPISAAAPAPEPVFERPAPPIAPPTPAAIEAEDSLFDDAGAPPGEPEPSGDAPMDTEMDFPVDRRTSPPAARMGGSAAPAAAPSPDVARMLQEFERRIATLEARLDESNEAREKLERQVAAQSEELRVQRAAIARTQRALRTMTRGDEDKATEPALRDDATQAKTRVTP